MLNTVDTWSVNSNYRYNGKMLMGKICFGPEGFCFKADSVNGKIKMGLIPYDKIKEVNYKRVFGFFSNGLLVVLKDGTEMFFIPLKHKKVRDFMKSKIIL